MKLGSEVLAAEMKPPFSEENAEVKGDAVHRHFPCLARQTSNPMRDRRPEKRSSRNVTRDGAICVCRTIRAVPRIAFPPNIQSPAGNTAFQRITERAGVIATPLRSARSVQNMRSA